MMTPTPLARCSTAVLIMCHCVRLQAQRGRAPSLEAPPTPERPLGARFNSGGAGSKSERKSQSHRFGVGDRVEVRDDPSESWQRGVVESLQGNGRPRVKRDLVGGAAFPWNEVPLKCQCALLRCVRNLQSR
jgi:hypothetical protein